MNRKPSGSKAPLTPLLSRAISGFSQFKAAEALSPGTIRGYVAALAAFAHRIGDRPIADIASDDIVAYFSFLRTDYRPQRFDKSATQPLSPKSLRNVWICLKSFFTWAAREFALPDPMLAVPTPKYRKAPVTPLRREHIETMLKACDFTFEADTLGRRRFVMRRSSALRDRAILLLLLDTGLRASELCALTIADVDLKAGRITVKHGVTGGAKGGKGRFVQIGKATRRTVWRYLASRADGEDPSAPLILGRRDRPMNRDGLRLLVKSLARRAGVPHCHPHQFRHTFAINYLRAGGDVFTLQALLGHGSLDMVQHYARIADSDIERAHLRASPADAWRL